jgi:hypothetical protein
MLNIRPNQMKVFEEAALRRFEDEMVVHSKEFTPRLCEVLGDEQLRVALRQAMKRAEAYGFTFRGPIRLYIELMFLCGSDFDTDPQYPAIGEVLNASGDQMQRAEQLHEGVIDYQGKVSGPDGVNVRKALEALSVFARKPVTVSSSDFVPAMLQEMTRAFPKKVVYTGEERLTRLIQEGRAEAREYAFPTVRGEALIVILMFAFGHGCTHDPLYPWIARTLKDERIKDPAARAERLEKKAITWLDHVLARPPKGVQT